MLAEAHLWLANTAFALVKAYRIQIPERRLPFHSLHPRFLGQKTDMVEELLSNSLSARILVHEQAVEVGKPAGSPQCVVECESCIADQGSLIFSYDKMCRRLTSIENGDETGFIHAFGRPLEERMLPD